MLALLGIKSKAMFGLGLIAAGLLALNYFQYKIHTSDIETIATLKAEVSIAEQTIIEKDNRIQSLNDQRDLDQNRIMEFGQQVSKLEVQYDIAKNKLEGFKDRQNVALKKPELVGKLANRATERVFNDLACATGSRGKGC